MSLSPLAQKEAGQYRRALTLSAIVHLLLLLALSSSLILIPRQPIPSRAISAFIVDEDSLKQSTSIKPPDKPAVNQPPPEAPPKEVEKEDPLAEQKKQQEIERKEQERKQAEVKAQAEAERKQQEQKAAEAKAKAKAREKAEVERKEQERKQAEAKAKAEAERQEQERKAAEAKAEAARREKARREAELAAAMAAEEDLWAAQRSGEMDRYIALIQQKVERNWVPPAGAQTGLECEVAVVQLPNGDVVDARTVRCNGDAAVQRSIEAAVRRSSPLPLPDNRALFERNLRFIFKPQQ